MNDNILSFHIDPKHAQGNTALSMALAKPLSLSRDETSNVDAATLAASTSKRLQSKDDLSTKNIQKSISIMQAADTALSKVENLLQQGKDLANGMHQEISPLRDKQKLQDEINRINQNIDHIGKTIPEKTGISLDMSALNQNDIDIINCLKSDWLESAETVIADRYGLTADGADLGIVLDESANNYLAAVFYENSPSGKATNAVLHVAVPAISPATLPDGGNPPVFDDRIIAHEMVHAVMGRTMNYSSLPTWFKEGTAEFISGANERISLNLARAGGGLAGATVIQNALGDGTDVTWVNDTNHYSAATVAVRYLHDNIKANGHSGGIKDLMTDLKKNPKEDLNEALRHVSSYKSVADFVSDFVDKNTGAIYINRLDLAHQLTTPDTGAIGGATVDGGPVLDARSVVPDIYHYTDTPLKHFKIQWPAGENSGEPASELQIRQGNTSPRFDSQFLGTRNADVINDPNGAAAAFDRALSRVAVERSRLGESQKQLTQSWQMMQTSPTEVPANGYQARFKQPGQMAAFISAQSNQQPHRVLQLL